MSKSTPRKRRALKRDVFLFEYLKDFNAARAARAAGSSERSAKEAGYSALRDPEVQVALASARSEIKSRLGLELDDVLQELRALALSDVRDVVEWGATGKPEAIPSAKLTEATARAIMSVKVDALGAVTIKMHPKTPALIALGKHLGLREKIEHEHSSHAGTVTFVLPDNGRRPPPKSPEGDA